MNPDDLLRAAAIIVSREVVFDEEAALAARLRAAAERSGEAVKVPKGWQITPIKCDGCGRGSNENCGRHPDKACMREFCDKQPRTAWADPLPDVIHPAPPIPQGAREDESRKAFEAEMVSRGNSVMRYGDNGMTYGWKGTYVMDTVRFAWGAWEAALAWAQGGGRT